MAYVLNNIRFRSVSSKSLERYYNVKAFVLAEMSDERRQFSVAARETLLLTFNSYSNWILEVENLMLNQSEITKELLYLMLSKQCGLVATNNVILDTHTQVFTPEFIQVWRQAHVHVNAAFKLRAKTIVGLTPMEAYPLLLDALVDALRMTMYELYELDCLMGSDLVIKPNTTNRCHTSNLVTYISPGDVGYYMSTGLFPILERLKVYEQTILPKDVVIPIIVKNYTEENIALKEGLVVGDNTSARLLNKIGRNERFKIVEIIH